MFYICSMKKKTIYTILVIIIILFTISCEQEKPKATPKEKTEDKTPTETPEERTEDKTPEDKTPEDRTEDKTPEDRTEDKTPEERTEDKTPAEKTEDKTPEERTEDKTPEETTEDKTPEERTEDKTSEERTEDKTPEETPKTAGDYIQEAKDEKAKGNDREAEEALSEAIRLSDSDEARRLRSEIYLINRQYDEAYEDASKAIELDSNNYLNYENRLKVLKEIIDDVLVRKKAIRQELQEAYIAWKAKTKTEQEAREVEIKFEEVKTEFEKYATARNNDRKEIKRLKT